MTLRVLILGGTFEANELARRLAADARMCPTLSYAGRTANRRPALTPIRVGGFGGANGLAEYLKREAIDVLVDATHPFAVQISGNAASAAASANVALIVLERPAWQPGPLDRWTFVPDLYAAVAALPSDPSRIFLAVGRQSIAPFAAKPQHHYLIRVIEPPEVPKGLTSYEIVSQRPPFRCDIDAALLRSKRIDLVVTKNSGGTAAFAKLKAARQLGVPVIIIDRPVRPSSAVVESVDDVIMELDHHHDTLAKRSV
jgi:precorrin-6A/cobalt-precorrin-6A reductase